MKVRVHVVLVIFSSGEVFSLRSVEQPSVWLVPVSVSVSAFSLISNGNGTVFFGLVGNSIDSADWSFSVVVGSWKRFSNILVSIKSIILKVRRVTNGDTNYNEISQFHIIKQFFRAFNTLFIDLI